MILTKRSFSAANFHNASVHSRLYKMSDTHFNLLYALIFHITVSCYDSYLLILFSFDGWMYRHIAVSLNLCAAEGLQLWCCLMLCCKYVFCQVIRCDKNEVNKKLSKNPVLFVSHSLRRVRFGHLRSDGAWSDTWPSSHTGIVWVGNAPSDLCTLWRHTLQDRS